MCYVIYGSLIFLFGLYSYDLLEQYALAGLSGENTPIVVAIGSEMLLELWPVLMLTAVLASAITFFAGRLYCSK